jgi:MoaA/NifB/PqqE/SkfB family radical SAM enzyme
VSSTTSTAIADAVAEGRIGGRVWFYANYHCNLECSYCLTESGPNVKRRMLSQATMVSMASQARDLGFTDLGVTGGEPFMVSSMPDTIEALSEILPIVVLSNATLFNGSRLERVARFAGKPIQVQVSLDAPDAAPNDTKRGADNWSTVAEAVPRLVERGVRVRLATTVAEGELDPFDHERLCELHRSWGVPDEDHVVRPIVSRGRAATDGIGVHAGPDDLPAELCITTDGAFWSAFGPTVQQGRMATDLLITRTTNPVRVPAEALLRIAGGRPPGADAALGIR